MEDEVPAIQEAQGKAQDILLAGGSKGTQQEKKRQEAKFKISHGVLIGLLVLVLFLHGIAIFLFTNGFLLSRLILEHKSECAVSPIDPVPGTIASGTIVDGCWHPKAFNKAVVLVIDALRYDFTVPFKVGGEDASPHHYHDSLKILYDTAAGKPRNAFLRPFISDAPTTTLQRLKGLTTGNIPTFIDAGSNFAGTAIGEDNLIAQLHSAGKRIVQLGDDTWQALFPGLFDPDLTKPYDSFNVWDLFTVDNGVTEHLLPLLQPSNQTKWDVIIGHFLGVDHAGHRYGPDHPAMAGKLQEMDRLLQQVVPLIDDETLLVVMGDHGMDVKGDHGGESDDEVQAALWMYSRRDVFGRNFRESLEPPATAKDRPVAQIDLVPTLALLLGLPIPFNNLGAPIEEAFIGPKGTDYKNYAEVQRLTAAQIHRYQDEYALVRKADPEAFELPNILYHAATTGMERRTQPASGTTVAQWESIASGFKAYQDHNLDVCKELWSRFNPLSIAAGITISLLALATTFSYAHGMRSDINVISAKLVLVGTIALLGGASFGFFVAYFIPGLGSLRSSLVSGALACVVVLGYVLNPAQRRLSMSLPRSVWSWSCVIFVLLLSLGFGANSFTIWEDEILLFFLVSFGVLMFTQSFRLKSSSDRAFASYHSIIFTVMIRLASLSRLCREEQMPKCKSTFYASAASSTSAPWQLAIPYLIAIILPTTIKTYYDRTSSYQGSAPFWIGIAFRSTLFMIAAFWTLDASADHKWLDEYVSEDNLKTTRMYLAQLVLAIAGGAGLATFGWQSALIGIERLEPTVQQADSSASVKAPAKSNGAVSSTQSLQPSRPQIMLHGTNNLYGSHFAILPFTVLLIPLLLLQKPMGQATLACVTTAIFSLLELLHLLRQPRISTTAQTVAPITAKADTPTASTYVNLGATILALLGHFAYFKTGHQATLASIQWDAAFIPLRTIRYPWVVIFMLFNTFAGQILCAAAVPCLVLWRRPFDFTTSPTPIQTARETPVDSESPSADRTAGKAKSTTKTLSVSESPDRSASSIAPATRTTSQSQSETLLADVAKVYLKHVLVYAVINLATTVFAAHLRRHLMLYRVFSPRWMLGSVGMIVAELFGILFGVGSVRWTVGALGALFGW